ncbi:MAG: hypothetical protein JRE28_10400 [Deltaproteobacteria bacterium]|nr:hypothetical protein [Deltaproteobacteria bacterium]
MLTIDQAKKVLIEVIDNIQVKHADYMLLSNSLELLYDGAKEYEESRQTALEQKDCELTVRESRLAQETIKFRPEPEEK